MTKKKTKKTGWAAREVDASYLVDSGLLFELNRHILHQFGIALGVRQGDGVSELFLLDEREEGIIFSPESFEDGKKKYARFMEAFGRSQLKKRLDELGWTFQNSPRK